METAVSKRGQIVIPAKIRHERNIKEGDRFIWINDGSILYMIPVSDNPMAELRGSAEGENLVEQLLEERRLDRERENRDLEL